MTESRGGVMQLADIAAGEGRILAAALRSVLRRPLAPVMPEPGCRHFGAMNSSGYGNTVVMLIVLIALETPATHFVLGSLLRDGFTRTLVRCTLLGTSVYLGLWLLGDLRLLRETPGVTIGPFAMTITLGMRYRGEVALHHVTEAQVITQNSPLASPTTAHALQITPQPRPNCRIRLSEVITLRGPFGIPLRGDTLDLYVDDPEDLVAWLHTRST